MDLIQELRRWESFLIPKEVMELLQLRRNTVCDRAQTGRIPTVHVPSGYKFGHRVLTGWLAARRANPGRRAA
jgi:predicted DNA-binding transcriptional regulator AlpA